MILAVDFDGTLCEDCYPLIGKPNRILIEELKLAADIGDRLILWTCRSGHQLDEAVSWCASYGLNFDRINENLPEIIERYGSDSRKIFADMYIDDRLIMPGELMKQRLSDRLSILCFKAKASALMPVD